MAPHDGDASASRDPHGRLGLAVRPAVLQALLVLAGFLAWTSAWVALSSPSGAPAAGGSRAWRGALSSANQEWQEDFDLARRELTPSGESRYFILSPGFQLVLSSGAEVLTITVLEETREINGITARVVEEREEVRGQLVEVSRNYFAMDKNTGDVFYFGEDVDDYQNGRIVGHPGAWLAYANGNKPGLVMPGNPDVGMKYYQEVAPGVAMDRAEVVSTSETCRTQAGEFEGCLIVRETTPLEPNTIGHKSYAPGIGLIQDQSLRLTSYRYVDLAQP